MTDDTLNAGNWLDKLDERETIFVLEYLRTLNVRQSAKKAGYSDTTAQTIAYLWTTPPSGAPSSDDKRKPKVYAAIQFGLALRHQEAMVTAEMVVRELKSIGFADPRELLSWDTTTETEEDNDDGGDTLVVRKIVSNTVRLKSSADISDEMAAAIKEIRQHQDGSISVKLHDKRSALADLGKFLGILDDRVRVMGANGGPITVVSTEMSPEDAAKAWAAMLDGSGS